MAKYTRDDWKPGQKVWFRSRTRVFRDGYATVHAVGRRWVTLVETRGVRFAIDTGIRDGGTSNSSGQYYPSKEACDHERTAQVEYDNVAKEFVLWNRSSWATPDVVKQIKAAIDAAKQAG